MMRLQVLTSAEERKLLGAAAASRQPFLGADPVTENVAKMHRRLQESSVTLLAIDDAGGRGLAGFGPVAGNPRQAWVDLLPLTLADPDVAVTALVQFLADHHRIESFLKTVVFRDEREPAFRRCGFDEIGRLRDHWYAAGRYHDVPILQLSHNTSGMFS